MIFDANCHIGSSNMICYLTKRQYTVEDLIRVMDVSQVDKACVSGDGLPHMIRQMNEDVLKAVEKYSDRIIGFLRVNPWDKEMLKQIDYYVGEKGFKGIRLHPMADGYCLLLEPNLNLLLKKAARYGVPIYVHTGMEPWSMPGQLLDLARRFPDVTFIMGHCGLNNLYHQAISSAAEVQNVLIESSIGPAIWAIKEIGKERIIFGSEWPTTSMRCQLAKILDGNLTKEEKEYVLWKNLQNLLTASK